MVHPQLSLSAKRGNPVIGLPQAPVGLILVEDFHCHFCRIFSLEIFPKIQEQFLDTGLAYCVYVPVAFLAGSKPLANAALAVYHHAPDRFVPYMHALFEKSAKENDLIPIAQQIGGIDLDTLQTCIETDCFSEQIEGNLSWAKQLMGPNFSVPALFVNGVRTPTSSFDVIAKEIERQ